MNKKQKIIIVDDHQMFRDGLKFLLSNVEFVEVINEAENGLQFLEILDKQLPDIVLMDISMPEMDGVTATKIALEKYPDIKIIALSMFGDEEYYYKMIHAGVKGFVLKESGSHELVEAIESVMNDNNYFSQELLRNIIISINNPKTPEGEEIQDVQQMSQEQLIVNEKIEDETEDAKISKRELEVLQYVCIGLSPAEIGEKLNISKRTVEGHKSSLLAKTSSKNVVNLIMYAIKNKLVTI